MGAGCLSGLHPLAYNKQPLELGTRTVCCCDVQRADAAESTYNFSPMCLMTCAGLLYQGSESVPVEAVHARKEDVEHGDRRGRREREVAVAWHWYPRGPRPLCHLQKHRRFRLAHGVWSGWADCHVWVWLWARACAGTVVCLCRALLCVRRQSRVGLYGRGVYLSILLLRGASFVLTYQLQREVQGSSFLRHGKGTTTDPTLVKAPPGYHSVHGGPHKVRSAHPNATASSMWVVYDRAQSYPAFVVTYSVRKLAMVW